MIAATSGYVIACYGITVAVLGGYGAWTFSKYRAARRRPVTQDDA